MTDAAPADAPARKKRGPNTPEGKARSVMNALKHGLRAREFGLLPEEGQPDWAQHVADLRAGYGPVDATEEKLVTAIAVAMWNEIRADRTLAETMAEIPPCRPGRSHGTDLHDPAHGRSLGTAIRYMTAAGMATQRAQRAFLAYRKAKQSGQILPTTLPAEPANENRTNEFSSAGGDRVPVEAVAEPGSEKCTNELRRSTSPAAPEHLAVQATLPIRAPDGTAHRGTTLPPEVLALSGGGRWHAPTPQAYADAPIRAVRAG
jgi:hypothetical protein